MFKRCAEYINCQRQSFKKCLFPVDSLKLPAQEKQEYKRYLENLRYQNSMMDSNYNSGRIEGVIEGRMEGRIEEKIEIAKKMKAAGITNEVIQQVTGLTKDEIDSEL